MNSISSQKPHLFGLLAGLFLASGLCFSAIALTRTWTHLHESQVVEVTGSAHRNVVSDLVVWHASFSVQDPTLAGANKLLAKAQAATGAFFRSHNLARVQFASVQISQVRPREKRDDDALASNKDGYVLTQPIVVTSDDVPGTIALASESSKLIDQGVAFVSDGMEFIYTRASDAKVEMMAEATKDARNRADQIAGQGDRKVSQLRAAHMGVVQINPLYSTATSWEGNSDTTSVEKTITATVNATFALE